MHKTSFLRSAFFLAMAPIVIGTGCSTTPPVTTGSLQITVAGTPGGQASLIVSGPSGFLLAVDTTTTLTSLVPGAYTILAKNVVVSNATYGVALASTTVTVAASHSPATAYVSYALVSGALAITITGLPSSLLPSVVVAGPGGFDQTITASQTLSNIPAGSYTLTSNPVISQGPPAATYRDTLPPLVVVVPASLTPVPVGVPYGLASGAMIITITGLPSGVLPSVELAGPAGFGQTITASQTLSNILPGTYTVTTNPVLHGTATYADTLPPVVVVVPASLTPVVVGVPYDLVSGALTITITGLPAGLSPSVGVFGQGGLVQTITASQTLSNIPAGTYTLAPNPVSQGTATYGDTLPPVVVVVPASLTPVAVSIPYMVLIFRIDVRVNAPAGVIPSVLVTGPGGYSRPITTAGLTTLTGLSLGSYTVAATAVTLGDITYCPPSVAPILTLTQTQRTWADTINYERAMLTIAFASGTGIDAINADGSGLASLTSSSDNSPVWSPDGTKIAFVSTRDGNSEIYLMNANGSGQTNLTNNPGNDYMPVWSPDGTKIAFESVRDGNSEIYVMRADGSGQVNLTGNPADDFHPSWSPDGKKIAFESHRDGNAEIYVMNADGTGQVNLTNNPALDALPTWSPDGTRIAFLSYRGFGLAIYTMRTDGTVVTMLDPGLANPEVHPAIYRPNSGPVWSPHGTKIAFLVTELKGTLHLTSLYVMNGDGSSLLVLSRAFPFGSAPGSNRGVSSIPTWSPDETAIAFTKYLNGVFVAHVDGTGSSLVHQSGADASPAWRP